MKQMNVKFAYTLDIWQMEFLRSTLWKKNPPWMHFLAGKRELSHCLCLFTFAFQLTSMPMLLDWFFSQHVKTCISKHRFQVWWLSSSLCPLSAQNWSEGDHKKNRPRCWFQIFVDFPNWWSQEICIFQELWERGRWGCYVSSYIPNLAASRYVLTGHGRKHDQYIYIW